MFVAAVALGLACTGFGQSKAPVAPRIVQQIDERQLVPLRSTSALARFGKDVGAAPDNLQMDRLTLVLKRTDAQRAELDKLVDQQQNPSSPLFHKWLTPEEFGQRYGIAEEDLNKTIAWLQSHGFKVDTVWAGRDLITFSGTHAQFKNAFYSEIRLYRSGDKVYWASASAPKIPAALAPVIARFVSLDNYHPHPLHSKASVIRKDKKTGQWQRAETSAKQGVEPLFTATSNGSQLYAVTPYDFAKIYNVEQLWNEGFTGEGQHIAINAASDIKTEDVDYFRSVFGLPPSKLNKIYYGPNPGFTDSEAEADLDVQWSGGVAKDATIDLVISSDPILAAAYAVNNNVAPILSVSWGICEMFAGDSNQFYKDLWQQAAAQGITVTVASGDASNDMCGVQSWGYEAALAAGADLSVNALASTPYNIAVGGTDLYGTYTAPDAYWTPANDSNNSSARSYMPELPWNNTCANPQLLAALQNLGKTTATTVRELCNEQGSSYPRGDYFSIVGAGGGASNCVSTDSNGNCAGGHSKPAWQTGVLGVTDDGVRDLPDVSLMSGSGLWRSFLTYCESDATSAGQCDINSEIQGAGGTSFAAPSFAGMLALVQQKAGIAKLGNANWVIYKSAASQYSNGSLDCNSSTVKDGNSCIFYDVQQGSNAVACDLWNWGSPVQTPNHCIGQSSDNREYSATDSYNAVAGYDMATGLGSVNAYNLANRWKDFVATLPSTTTLTTAALAFPYGSSIDVTVTVAATTPGAGSKPVGDVMVTLDSQEALKNVASLTNGATTFQFGGVEKQAGSYQLSAQYLGDGSFTGSSSAPLTLTITPMQPSSTLTADKNQLTGGESVTLFMNIAGIRKGVTPTGTATFRNAAGKVLGDATLERLFGTDLPTASAYLGIPSAQLATGKNSISVTYNGDKNYASVTQVGSVTLNAPYSVAVTPAAMTLDLSAGKSATATITVTSQNNATVYAPYLNFSCPGNLPVGLTCSLSAPTAGANGTVSSLLTLTMTSQVHATRAGADGPALPYRRGLPWPAGLLAGLALVGVGSRSKNTRLLLMLIVTGAVIGMVACGGDDSHKSTTVALAATSTTPALNSPVTLTATVTPVSGKGSPTGTITFLDGATTLATANLTNGTATYSSSSLAVGPHPVLAKYSGNPKYTTSTSSSVNVDVIYTSTLAINVIDTTTGFSTGTNVGITVR